MSGEPYVKEEHGWFVAYDQKGVRIARFATHAAADAACARWQKLGARIAKPPPYGSQPPKETSQPKEPR